MTNMITNASHAYSLIYRILLSLLALAAAVALEAQPANGTISGRVFNSGAKEYARNAEVRIEGTNLATYTTDGGFYRLPNVAAGEVRISVRYAGAETAIATITVIAGQTTVKDFELRELTYGAGGDEVIQLEKLEVAGARVGQAKALMESRAALNAKNVVAADNYGELTMGDVGEFMKSMPGLSLDYVEVDTSAVRIGGLDPKYSNFTTDGVRMATATSNNNTGRQNSFEQMSITGIESIEFNNTLNANMDADSPGGAINLRSKYAFQRTGRTIIFQFYGVGTSDADLKREYFPDDRKHYRIFPSGQFGYADIFLKGRLGVEFNASYNANFVQQDRIQMRYNYNNAASGATVANPKLNDIMFRPGPKMTSREAANLSVDFKITPNLVFSWRSSYSFYDVEYVNQYTYLYAPVATQPAESTTTNLIAKPVNATTGAAVTAGSSPRLRTEYSHRYAGTPVYVLAPKLEYKGDTWEATARASYSRSEFNFRDNSKGFFVRTDDWITRLGFTATRPSEDSPTWTLAQTDGRPWGDPTSWNRDDSIGNTIRTSESDAINEMRSGYLDIKKQLGIGGLPVTFMAGFGSRGNDWRTTEGSYKLFQYVGPTNDPLSLEAVIPWTKNYKFDLNLDGKGGNMTAQNWRADSNYAVYDIYKQHPDYFVPDSLGNTKRQLDNNKRISEEITATYMEAQTRIGRARFDLGFRYEKTKTKASIAQIRPLSEVAAAGYPVSATAATTIPGLLYQYHDGRQITRHGRYDDWFLSGGVKYEFTRKLVGQVAFSSAILRPDYGNLGGVTSVNENTMTVTVPNPQLKPEHSTKYYAGLKYYIEPSGLLGVSCYRLNLRDMQQAGYTVNPEDVGFSPDDYPGYAYVSAQNSDKALHTDGYTVEYSQQLTFLPRALKGISLYGSFTRVVAEGVRIGVPGKMANWGLRYRYGRVGVHINGTWQAKSRLGSVTDTEITGNTGIRWLAAREIWGVSVSYRITKHFDLMLSGRNIFNAPSIQFSNISSRIYLYDVYGSMWNAGIRGSF